MQSKDFDPAIIEGPNTMEHIVCVDAAIREAEREFAADGVLHDAKEAAASLRKKHFG